MRRQLNKHGDKVMKTQVTVEDCFRKASLMNPKETIVSSIGEVVTKEAERFAEEKVEELMQYLPKGTLARKIVSDCERFTDKQLWVIAYELLKNEEFVEELSKELDELAIREEFKRANKRIKVAEKRAFKKEIDNTLKNNSKLTIGAKVRHAQYGEGIVTSIDEVSISVDFNGKVIRLAKKYVHLELL